MLKVHSHVPPLPQVSLLHPCLVPGTLPCQLPSYHTWFKSCSQPLSFAPSYLLCFQNSTGPQPCLSYHLSQPGAPKLFAAPPLAPHHSQYCRFCVCCLPSTNCELSPTVLCHDCLVAHIKLNTDTVQTPLICGLFSKGEHWVCALLNVEIYSLICQAWNEMQDKISSITRLRWFLGWQVSALTCCDSLSVSSVANFTWLFSIFYFHGLIPFDLGWVHREFWFSLFLNYKNSSATRDLSFWISSYHYGIK